MKPTYISIETLLSQAGNATTTEGRKVLPATTRKVKARHTTSD